MRETVTVTLELTTRGLIEERQDRWAVWTEEFGFMSYGHTRAEADQAFLETLTALIHSFDKEAELRDYLDRKGVQHRFVRTTSTPPVITGDAPVHRVKEVGRFFERQFEVPIGAVS